ncbi:prenyltransferase [Thermococcus indicus]|uniref:Prenyltransferase n=1 Tax=Thermococcus indicus TaxID=2586643 RepID=A0A4Y5SLX2_9EURY|nr:prenyltransferase [Thermococcus indicus]QDA31907.1 prenyltransferase [Thermococcus indicus]
MLVKEILSSVDVIADGYVKSTTYAKIGERLARTHNELYREAFVMAVEAAREIDDPPTMFRALLSIGYSMAKAGIKSFRRVYNSVLEDSKVLPQSHRDVVMKTAVEYLLSLGYIGDAILFASEIHNEKLRNKVLVEILARNTALIGRDPLKAAYRLRRNKLVLEYVTREPYRSRALAEVVKGYLYSGNYENAILSLREIVDRNLAKHIFKEVVFYLKDKGVLGHHIDLLENVADEMAEKLGRDFLPSLAFAFALSGQGFSAVRLVRKVGGEEVLEDIALELLLRDGDALPGFLGALNEEEAESVGKAVMNAILERPSLGSDSIVRAVENSTGSEDVLVKVARYYIVTGKLGEAMRIARSLRTERLRSITMADIAHNLVKAGRVEDAIDVALEVRDARFSSILISEILLKALEQELPGRVKSWNGSRH